MNSTVTQPANDKPTWLKIPLPPVFHRHIKSAAARRGVTAQRFIMDAVEQLVGAPPKELIEEMRRAKRPGAK